MKKLADAVKRAAAKKAAGDARPDAGDAVGLRERKKSRTHDAIVEAAVELFERKGFEATTVEEIATAADISPRTFFRYFDSKVDVVMPGRKEGEPAFEEELTARLDELGPIEAIHQMFRDEVTQMLEERPIAARQLRVVMSTPTLRAQAFDHFQEHQEQIRKLVAVRLGTDEDGIRAHLTAAGVGTTMWTVVDRWVAEGAPADRLLPLLDEGFTLLATGFDALEP